MPGTRTAPTVDGSPSYINASFVWYDYTGDQRTDTYQFDGDSTNAEIEALAAALQAASNATLWRIKKSDTYNSVGDPSNALEEVWENAKDNIVLLAKNAANNSQDFYIPSPINDMFIEGTESIDPTDTTLNAVLTAIAPMQAGYGFVSARFTHRRQIGTAVRF